MALPIDNTKSPNSVDSFSLVNRLQETETVQDELKEIEIKTNLQSIKSSAQDEFSGIDLSEIDSKLAQLAAKAEKGDVEALHLLERCAQNQAMRTLERLKTIKSLQSYSTFLEECHFSGRDPRKGYITSPSYYMTPEYNAFFQLATCYAKSGDLEKAVFYYAQAYQTTDYIGEAPLINQDLQNAIKAQYLELTRRVPSDKLEEIHNITSQIKDLEGTIRHMTNQLRSKNYDLLFKDKDEQTIRLLPYVALHAVKLGYMTVNQFDSFMSRWSLIERKAEIVYLFDQKNEENSKAFNLIYDSMFPLQTKASGSITISGADPFLTRDQVTEMFELMRSYPSSEQCFFITDDTATWDRIVDRGTVYHEFRSTVGQFISYSAGFNVFARPSNLRLGGERMIPTASLEEAFLRTRYKTKGVFANRVVGSSDAWDIRLNGLQRKRDTQVPFNGFPLPKMADKRRATLSEDFKQHDFFHTYSSSEIGDHAEYFIGIADYIQTHPIYQEFHEKDSAVHLFWEAMVDLDMPEYRHQSISIPGWLKDKKLEMEHPGTKFWLALSRALWYQQGKSPEVNKILEGVVEFVLHKNWPGINAEALKATADHVRISLEKHEKHLPTTLQWICKDHPIFIMEKVV